jgi:hypothetical protein
MLSEVDKPLYGIRTDIVQDQHLVRMSEIDQRISSRFVPDEPLPPNFGARPVMTKYAVFPMVDNRMPTTEPIQPNYAVSGGVANFQRNIDSETELRCYSADVYIPSSQSDLYRTTCGGGQGTGENTVHNLLFRQFVFDGIDDDVDKASFHINTRARLRE